MIEAIPRYSSIKEIYNGLRVYRKTPKFTIAVDGLRGSTAVFARVMARKPDTAIGIETAINRTPKHSAGVRGRKRIGNEKWIKAPIAKADK